MTGKRKWYSWECKAKGAPAAKHGVHPTMVNVSKKRAVEGMVTVFSGKAEAADAAHNGELTRTTCSPAAGLMRPQYRVLHLACAFNA